MAVKACQDESVTSLTSEIEECFEVIEAVMRFEPKREFTVCCYQLRRTTIPVAACRDPHCAVGALHGKFTP